MLTEGMVAMEQYGIHPDRAKLPVVKSLPTCFLAGSTRFVPSTVQPLLLQDLAYIQKANVIACCARFCMAIAFALSWFEKGRNDGTRHRVHVRPCMEALQN